MFQRIFKTLLYGDTNFDPPRGWFEKYAFAYPPRLVSGVDTIPIFAACIGEGRGCQFGKMSPSVLVHTAEF